MAQNSRDILQDRGFMLSIVAETFQQRKYGLWKSEIKIRTLPKRPLFSQGEALPGIMRSVDPFKKAKGALCIVEVWFLG